LNIARTLINLAGAEQMIFHFPHLLCRSGLLAAIAIALEPIGDETANYEPQRDA
jgi:hypothetical protein